MRKSKSDEYLTAQEVADRLGMHVNTIKRLGDRGELPFFRVSKRGDRRIQAKDVDDYLTNTTAAFVPRRSIFECACGDSFITQDAYDWHRESVHDAP